MIVRSTALVRLPQLSRADFQSHWRDRHAPLIIGFASVLGIISYRQVHAQAPEGEADPAFDGFAHVVFESHDAFRAMLGTPAGVSAAKAVWRDEQEFIDTSRSVSIWGSEQTII